MVDKVSTNRTATCLVVLNREPKLFRPDGWVQELRKLVAVGYVAKEGNRYTVSNEGVAFLKTIKEPTQ